MKKYDLSFLQLASTIDLSVEFSIRKNEQVSEFGFG